LSATLKYAPTVVIGHLPNPPRADRAIR